MLRTPEEAPEGLLPRRRRPDSTMVSDSEDDVPLGARVQHAPAEAPVASVRALWALAAQPLFVWYALSVVTAIGALIARLEPRHGGERSGLTGWNPLAGHVVL